MALKSNLKYVSFPLKETLGDDTENATHGVGGDRRSEYTKRQRTGHVKKIYY
jgi:hypothetical protein